ncbi:MAG: Arc/MetJ-type ribon-helix-helix transcriptional regulator [Candidatus Nitrosomirales archaeon]|jgi:Arc/MetJ-type ribon-helix-helix transcriptional regulator
MPSSYNLPELVKKEIEALVRSGYYSSKSDVVKDALRYMLESKKNLRLAAAIELYKQGDISLGKAAEVANMSIIEFKETLSSQDHKRLLTVSRKDIKKADELMAKSR